MRISVGTKIIIRMERPIRIVGVLVILAIDECTVVRSMIKLQTNSNISLYYNVMDFNRMITNDVDPVSNRVCVSITRFTHLTDVYVYNLIQVLTAHKYLKWRFLAHKTIDGRL